MMRKAINQFPYGETHMHIFMNGTDYKKAVADQKNGVCDRVIHAHLAEYRKRGITWLREGGDIYGTSKRTMELAPAYGITYRTPIFAIHKKGHYGAIVGRGYETMQEYRELIGELRRQGGHFVKIMISGIMDFTHGGLTMKKVSPSWHIQTAVRQSGQQLSQVWTVSNMETSATKMRFRHLQLPMLSGYLR